MVDTSLFRWGVKGRGTNERVDPPAAAEEEPGLPVEERRQRQKMACSLEGDASSV